ncbi:MAG: Coenzyme F420 hydrogenase/dehydrogenase, beta subunit C-terminal domain [Candidatus Rokubacteria bacterium]|nr:Coenzyme F420 hydrogenase/dehydrogenase, beta subunit C-terminal domain [Candidatus Rokubacteria bacterium]
MKRGGPADLEARVLSADLCTGCGACLGHCPYLKTLGERVAFVHPCSLTEGRCFAVCPRTSLDPDELDRRVLGTPRLDVFLGSYRRLLWSRSLDADIHGRAQYGGTTTALTAFALESGTVSAAVLTGGGPTSFPQPVVARDRDAVLAAAGTKYSACPTLVPVAGLLRESDEAFAVVGRPCQVAALRNVQANPKNAHRFAAVIGVFCFWALAPSFYRFVAAHGVLTRATKIDIPKEGGVVFSNGRTTTVPLDEIRPHIRPACQTCLDPTAEWADVSVGSTEHDSAWNTLVVRTARGQALVDAAVAAGALETRPYPPDRIPILRAAVAGKKRRVMAAVDEGDPATRYLSVSDDTRAAIMAGGRDVQ